MAHLGPSHEEIDDFLDQVNDVSAKLEAIKNGTDVDISEYAVTESNGHVDPGELAERIRKVNPDAVLTPEQAEALEARRREQAEEKARRRQQRDAEEAEKRRAEKEEEREKWWRHAEYEYGHLHEEPTAEDQEAAVAAAAAAAVADDDKRKKVDSLDYSKWEDWLRNPDDPVSREMLALAQAKLEEDKNDEFERNNPGFCAAFRADMAKRKKVTETREETAAKLKEKGNRAFGKKLVHRALHCYEEALDLKYDMVPLLTNIAQCHLRLKQYDDCLEFCNRALYVQPDNVKALSRRAKVHRLSSPPDFTAALADLTKATGIDAENKALRRELEETRVAAAAAKDEADVMRGAASQFANLATFFEQLKVPVGGGGGGAAAAAAAAAGGDAAGAAAASGGGTAAGAGAGTAAARQQTSQQRQRAATALKLQQAVIADVIAAQPAAQVFLRANGQLEWLTVTATAYLERVLAELNAHGGKGSGGAAGAVASPSSPVAAPPALSAAEVDHATLVLHLLHATAHDAHNLAFIRTSGCFRTAVRAVVALLNATTTAAGAAAGAAAAGAPAAGGAAALLRSEGDAPGITAALLNLLVRGAVDAKCQRLMLDGGGAAPVRAAARVCGASANPAVVDGALRLCASFASWTEFHEAEVARVLSATAVVPDCCAAAGNARAQAAAAAPAVAAGVGKGQLIERLAEALAAASHHPACHARFGAAPTPPAPAAVAAAAAADTKSSNSSSKANTKKPGKKKQAASSASTDLVAAAAVAPATVAGLLLDVACDPAQTSLARELAALALTNAALDAGVREAAVAHGATPLVELVVGSWQQRVAGASSSSSGPCGSGGGGGPSALPEFLKRRGPHAAGSGLKTAAAVKLLARVSRSAAALAAFRARPGTLAALTQMAAASVRACGDIVAVAGAGRGGRSRAPRSAAVLAAVRNLVQLLAVCLHGGDGGGVPAAAFLEFLAEGGPGVLMSCLLLSPRDHRDVDRVPADAGLDQRIDGVYVGNVLSSLISVNDFLATPAGAVTAAAAAAAAAAAKPDAGSGGGGGEAAVRVSSAADLARLFRESEALVHLVALLKSCEDGPVRENAAKLVARLGRDAPSMEVIRANRGMEVLMQLYTSGRLKV